MSLNYDLKLCTDMNAEQIRELMLTLAAGIRECGTRGILVGPGVTISTLPQSELDKEITKEKYGLEPTVKVNFRLDKFGAFDHGVNTAVRVSLQLLTTTKSDGLFLANHNVPVLLCRAGKITLDPGSGFWAGLPSLVGQPHSVGHLALMR